MDAPSCRPAGYSPMVSCRTSLAWMAVIALTSAGVPCPGEMIVLKDGQVHVGFVKSEEPAAIRLTGGSASGATEVVIPRVGVERRCRGEEEKRRIQECEDSGILEQWTAGYFQAGLEDTADRCLDRIFESDAARVTEPKAVGMEAFRTYWNRMVLRRRAAGVAESDAAELLRVAKWARKAGLAEEARDYIAGPAARIVNRWRFPRWRRNGECGWTPGFVSTSRRRCRPRWAANRFRMKALRTLPVRTWSF